MLAISLISIIFYNSIVNVLAVISCLFSEKYSESFNTLAAYSSISE